MEQGVILFADNHPQFLSCRKTWLEQAGYRVLTASNPHEARRILNSTHVDLAILDIRLEDDKDEKDISGLLLARDSARSVPKIMLTRYPSIHGVRAALSPNVPGGAVAADYITKSDDHTAFLRAVEVALRQKVFLVHGYDEEAKNAVVLWLRELGLRPIVLRDQPDAGRAILEKLEDYARVGFAIALLTPDDFGGSQQTLQDTKLRARQNVIFELGYCIGKLGRRRVCMLYKDCVEIPSDYHGVLYIAMDQSGAWKPHLARELQNAGLHIDLNSLL